MIIQTICAFFVAFSFGVLFNIQGKSLYVAGGGGALGWFVYKLLLNLSVFEPTALFLASISFSIYSEKCARILKTPSTLFRVCALIVLVPGYGIYNTLTNFIIKNYTLALDYCISTLSQGCSLALGVILVSSIYKSRRFKIKTHTKNLLFKESV